MPNPTRITTRNITRNITCNILALTQDFARFVAKSSVPNAFIVLEDNLDPNCWVYYQNSPIYPFIGLCIYAESIFSIDT